MRILKVTYDQAKRRKHNRDSGQFPDCSIAGAIQVGPDDEIMVRIVGPTTDYTYRFVDTVSIGGT